MQSVQLGRSGPVVSAVGYGCLSLTDYYGSGLAPSEGIRVIHHAIDRGTTLFDTAPMYGAGANESLLGRAVLGHRKSIFIATKFGAICDSAGRPIAIDGSPRHVRESCDASLARLQTDVIDLFFQHRLDKTVPVTGGGRETTILSTWITLAHLGMILVPIGYGSPGLRDASQVHGASPYGAGTIQRASAPRPSSLEVDIARYQGKVWAQTSVRLHG